MISRRKRVTYSLKCILNNIRDPNASPSAYFNSKSQNTFFLKPRSRIFQGTQTNCTTRVISVDYYISQSCTQKYEDIQTCPVHRTDFGQNNFPYLIEFFLISYLDLLFRTKKKNLLPKFNYDDFTNLAPRMGASCVQDAGTVLNGLRILSIDVTFDIISSTICLGNFEFKKALLISPIGCQSGIAVYNPP